MSYLEQELSKLLENDRQREAYLCDDHCVVLAGPGSGKTATLTMKIMRLLANHISPPQGLACITFNNEAVREFESRLQKLGLPSRQNVFLGTVHGFCLSAVIQPFARIYCPELPNPIIVAPEKERDILLQKAMDEIGIQDRLSQFQTRINRYRRTFLNRTSPSWLNNEDYARCIERYESLLRTNRYIDFDDIILIALKIIENEPFVQKCLSARFPWLVIDEYQDLGYPLHKIILCMLDKTDIKIFAVGDTDQSIYSFTGADPQYLQELATKSNIKSIQLELNYRCGQQIIDGAEVVLAPKLPREYRSSRGQSNPGEIYFVERSKGLEHQATTIVDEILPQLTNAGYEPKDISILYLDRNDATVITDVLEDRGVNYAGEKDQRYKRTPIIRWLENVAQWSISQEYETKILFKDISNFWIKLLISSGEIISEENILIFLRNFYINVNNLKNADCQLAKWLSDLDKLLCIRKCLLLRKQSPEEIEALDLLISQCGNNGAMENYTVSDFAGCGLHSNRIFLTTLHSSKGLEFDVVIIPGLEEGRLPSWNAKFDHALSEARRTFYVGLTRARYLVYLMYSGSYENQWGQTFNDGPSSFIKELQSKLDH